MKVEIPIELVKETVKALTDQINMEMEAEDPCPGIGVLADKQYPWYVELRNLFQDALDKRNRVLKFEINLDELNDDNPEAINCTLDDIKVFIKFLCNANPDYYIIGDMLKEQLDKQLKEE